MPDPNFVRLGACGPVILPLKMRPRQRQHLTIPRSEQPVFHSLLINLRPSLKELHTKVMAAMHPGEVLSWERTPGSPAHQGRCLRGPCDHRVPEFRRKCFQELRSPGSTCHGALGPRTRIAPGSHRLNEEGTLPGLFSKERTSPGRE